MCNVISLVKYQRAIIENWDKKARLQSWVIHPDLNSRKLKYLKISQVNPVCRASLHHLRKWMTVAHFDTSSEAGTNFPKEAEVQPWFILGFKTFQDVQGCITLICLWDLGWLSSEMTNCSKHWPSCAYRFLSCEWSPDAEKLKQQGETSIFSSWTCSKSAKHRD